MATKKASTSRAAKMREYYTANPTATASEVAKKFKTTYQIAYMCKKEMKPKKIVLNPIQLAVIKKSLEVPKAITMVEPQPDPVNHPYHYKVGGIETIDFIEAKSSLPVTKGPTMISL